MYLFFNWANNFNLKSFYFPGLLVGSYGTYRHKIHRVGFIYGNIGNIR